MNRNSFRPGFKNPRHYIFAIFVTALLALFLAPGAMAACNKKGKGKDCNPNQTPPSPGTSTALFDLGSNIHMEEGSFLDCGSGRTLSVDNGDYHCTGPDTAQLPDIHVTTDGFTGLFSKRFRDICGSLNSPPGSTGQVFAVLVPDEVSYGWRDDCTNGTCRMEVSMEFSDPEIIARTGGKADQLSIVLGGWLNGVSGDEANPFLGKDVTVMVDSVDLEFRLTGKNRAVGICPFGVAPPDLMFDVNYVIFDSLDP